MGIAADLEESGFCSGNAAQAVEDRGNAAQGLQAPHGRLPANSAPSTGEAIVAMIMIDPTLPDGTLLGLRRKKRPRPNNILSHVPAAFNRRHAVSR
ncbi:hypothetical protein BOSE62_50298 [Bosea sp. 62]|nr:hypothetical protein BOSE21B_100254 [Bosea sp. 21B]CAD5284891.1 hypothetical protein BOSE7B_41278 [Bosea sp. 7B]CAD5301631.1 hypothetical protein BOSE46_90620 [Bosea sp. 46]VVT57752.1 hypothetical protein BOS5A_200254 [Bosea sp. EC-HK365B]VXB30609.1 hypothetical protein BOSE29B_100062 [Bosea sp. 29B]VXB74284.1 hypothetical protein BOSE125_150061 [Bosea sp. 125]VXC63572.1 hypothetical protein BOSE62_50298 [Bosea sp. 62]VXC92235.1 hypothetical protein BOSE127_80061 [Bosea sp. 127]